MWPKAIRRLFSSKVASTLSPSEAILVPLAQLNPAGLGIPESVLKVAYTLKGKGFSAYIVGGAVRDLLLQQSPKDFDLVTDASPVQIKALFPRSRIIGRRFPIVHVYTKHEVLDVSSFSLDENSKDQSKPNTASKIYNIMDQDSRKRDFTCNALYLDPLEKTVHSYHGALEHLKANCLVPIGDPEIRLKEDPVRIIRGIRIAAKAQLTIEAELAHVMQQNAHFLLEQSCSRLFDEWAKVIYSKAAYPCFLYLKKLNILPFLHPITKIVDQYTADVALRIVNNTLEQTDKRLLNEQTISLGFVFAALLWPLIQQQRQQLQSQGLRPAHALHEAIVMVMNQKELSNSSIPNKNLNYMREIWHMQLQLERAYSTLKIKKLLIQPRFRAAYDFYLLRAQSGDADLEKAQQWTEWIQCLPQEKTSSAAPKKIAKPRRASA
ncbi:MAG: polynucleotide adenylyltransferase PcnB [Neisseriaceae bacterium]